MKIGFATIFFTLLTFAALTASETLEQADSLFALRDKNFDPQTLLADTTFINQAIKLYEKILQDNPDANIKSQALWKLLQAFYFKGQFGTTDHDQKKDIYSRGLKIGEEYVDKLPESVEVYAWLGVIWARWAEVYGTFAAARKGVAGKVKFYAEKTVALDDHYLDAGGYRLLGMLHFSVPKIPLILSWPSKEQALVYLEKANEIAPQNLYNKMYLAEVLYAQKQPERAKQLLLDIVNTDGIVHDLAIDSFIKKQARDFLAEHYGSN